MKAIFRNFFYIVKRFKTASVLNILGLSAALAVFSICAMQTYYDLTFNSSLKNANRLYLLSVYQDTNYGRWENYNPFYRYSEVIKNNQPLFNDSNTVRVMSSDIRTTYKRGGEEVSVNIPVTSVEPQFLDMVGLDIVAGNGRTALTDINKLIISEKTAKQFFGDKNPIGELLSIAMPAIHINGDKMMGTREDVEMMVSAVYKDFPTNNSFNNGMFTRLVPERFEYFKPNGGSVHDGSFNTYYMLPKGQKPSDIETILSDQKLLDLLNLIPPRKEHFKNTVAEGDPQVLKKGLLLTTLSNIQIDNPEMLPEKAKSSSSIWSIVAIGVITLLIAYINFTNFIMAMAPVRIRSINIHKIVGAGVTLLRLSILMEILLFVFISFGFALFAVYYISSTPVSSFFTADLLLKNNIGVIEAIAVGLVVLSLLVGIYPSFYLTSFDPVASYGGAGAGRDGKVLRNILTTIQFLAASILIFVTLFIWLQYQYFKSYDIGLHTEQVVIVNNRNLDWKPLLNDASAYMHEVTGKDGITNSTGSNFSLDTELPMFGQVIEDKQILYLSMEGSRNFLDFFGLKVLEGKTYTENKETEQVVVVNQKMMELYGESVVENDIAKAKTAVVEDFNYRPLYEEVMPLLLTLNDAPNYYTLYFKVRGDHLDRSIHKLETTWKQFTQSPFEYHLMDEVVDNLYKQERNLASLLSIFSLTAILIAIMGVYGLISFNSKYRAKEIAIRKVQGASIGQIMVLLNKGMLWQFGIAFVIAIPTAYYIIDKWLEQFVYKTPIYWWGFLIGASVVLLISILTVSVQSYRAASNNPMKALKNE